MQPDTGITSGKWKGASDDHQPIHKENNWVETDKFWIFWRMRKQKGLIQIPKSSKDGPRRQWLTGERTTEATFFDDVFEVYDDHVDDPAPTRTGSETRWSKYVMVTSIPWTGPTYFPKITDVSGPRPADGRKKKAKRGKPPVVPPVESPQDSDDESDDSSESSSEENRPASAHASLPTKRSDTPYIDKIMRERAGEPMSDNLTQPCLQES